MTSTLAGIDIRRYRDDDELAVRDLLRASLGAGPAGERPPEFFRWKHLRNPFGRSYMLVAEEDGRVVGFRSFLRWRFSAGDTTVTAVRAVDTATHPDFQGRGIFRTLTLAALDDLRSETDLVFNTPNAKSGPGYLKMGWRSVGRVPIGIRVRRPIRFLRNVRHLGADEPRRTPPRVEAETASGATLAGRASVGTDERLSTLRPPDYLTWRYLDAPLLDYRIVSDGDGAAIFRVRPRGRLWEATVVELFASDPAVGARLLRRVARSADVDHVSCSFPSGTIAASAARRCGFVPSPQGPTLMTNPLRDLPLDPGSLRSWALTLGDVEVF